MSSKQTWKVLLRFNSLIEYMRLLPLPLSDGVDLNINEYYTAKVVGQRQVLKQTMLSSVHKQGIALAFL
jgi:hypothetical protein